MALKCPACSKKQSVYLIKVKPGVLCCPECHTFYDPPSGWGIVPLFMLMTSLGLVLVILPVMWLFAILFGDNDLVQVMAILVGILVYFIVLRKALRLFSEPRILKSPQKKEEEAEKQDEDASL